MCLRSNGLQHLETAFGNEIIFVCKKGIYIANPRMLFLHVWTSENDALKLFLHVPCRFKSRPLTRLNVLNDKLTRLILLNDVARNV